MPVHLAELGGELIVQKDAFLAAAKGVSIGIAFQKKLGVGLFGGEGFIMQRLQGDGWAFIHAGGMLMERQLGAGEILRVDTGCIVGFQPSVAYDIQMVRGVKSAIFGGEGLFFATLHGAREDLAAVAAALAAGEPDRRGRAGRRARRARGGLGPRRPRQHFRGRPVTSRWEARSAASGFRRLRRQALARSARTDPAFRTLSAPD